ncbi:MAG: FAD:protein FMN transferase [Gammaproteobacteria bacterium]|nr:FAD:protein FMN transferase [Gammaproteobacteria bacterium]
MSQVPINQSTELIQADGYWVGRFQAMASPCEILLETEDSALAKRLLQIAADEAWRIEAKFSRYRKDNIVHQINTSKGKAVSVDEETAGLLDYAQRCCELSEGRFDITSGVLREVWRFDGSDNIPDIPQVKQVLARVGWDKLYWQQPNLQLQDGMEIDLGGIGKEYAVDRTVLLLQEALQEALQQEPDTNFVVNFGGDIYVTGPRKGDEPWVIALDDPRASGVLSSGQIQLRRGGVATSGDARRFLVKDGVRYSHILDPTTGWPVADAPHSVTVIAGNCMEAGMLATFAMLQGKQAKIFLEEQGVPFWTI